jgi:hypothetical protein
LILEQPPPHDGDAGAWDDHSDPLPPHGMKRPFLFQYTLQPLSAEAWMKTGQK